MFSYWIGAVDCGVLGTEQLRRLWSETQRTLLATEGTAPSLLRLCPKKQQP